MLIPSTITRLNSPSFAETVDLFNATPNNASASELLGSALAHWEIENINEGVFIAAIEAVRDYLASSGE